MNRYKKANQGIHAPEDLKEKVITSHRPARRGRPDLWGAAAAVLALQQLSQAADNQKRYAMLRRLGADDGLIARSASQQVALAFLMPLGLALIHSMVGMKAANDIIATAGKVDSVGSSLATAAVLILVYGGYFLATALACRRMARQSWTKLE